MQKNVAFGREGACIILAIGGEAPSETEWNAYLQFLQVQLGIAKTTRILVLAEEAPPTAVQRKKLNEITSAYAGAARVAVVTSSAFVRGAVTASSWFDKRYKAFSPQHLDDAMTWLEVPPAHFGAVRSLAESLQSQVDPDEAW